MNVNITDENESIVNRQEKYQKLTDSQVNQPSNPSLSNERQKLFSLNIMPYKERFKDKSNEVECLFLRKTSEKEEKMYTCECIGNHLTYICQSCYENCHTSKYCKRYLIKTLEENVNRISTTFGITGQKQKGIVKSKIGKDLYHSNMDVSCKCGKYRHEVPGWIKQINEEEGRNYVGTEAKPKEDVLVTQNHHHLKSESCENLIDRINDNPLRPEHESYCPYKDIIKFCIPQRIFECSQNDLEDIKKEKELQNKRLNEGNSPKKALKEDPTSKKPEIDRKKSYNIKKLDEIKRLGKKKQQKKEYEPLKNIDDESTGTTRYYCRLCLGLQFLIENLDIDEENPKKKEYEVLPSQIKTVEQYCHVYTDNKKISPFFSLIIFLRNCENIIGQDGNLNYFLSHFMDINFNIIKKLNFTTDSEMKGNKVSKQITDDDVEFFTLLIRDKLWGEIPDQKGKLNMTSEIFDLVMNSFYSLLLQENAKFVFPRKVLKIFCIKDNELDINKNENKTVKSVINILDSYYVIVSERIKIKNLKSLTRLMREYFFFFNYYFYANIKSHLQKNYTMQRTTTLCNMTIPQREYVTTAHLNDIVFNEMLKEFYKSYLNMYYSLDFLIKQLFNTSDTSSEKLISDEIFYQFIKITKFCIKYKLFNHLHDSDIEIEIIHTLNEILINNVSKYKQEATNTSLYIKLPSLEIIFDIVILSLLYYNDSKAILILNGKKTNRKKQEYCYVYNHNDILMNEISKLFGNAIILRNLAKDLVLEDKNDIITVDTLFYDLKFNFNKKDCKYNYQIYDSLGINYRIKYILNMYLPSFAKDNNDYKKNDYLQNFNNSIKHPIISIQTFDKKDVDVWSDNYCHFKNELVNFKDNMRKIFTYKRTFDSFEEDVEKFRIATDNYINTILNNDDQNIGKYYFNYLFK